MVAFLIAHRSVETLNTNATAATCADVPGHDATILFVNLEAKVKALITDKWLLYLAAPPARPAFVSTVQL